MALKKPAGDKGAPADARHHARDLPALLQQLCDPQADLRRWAARDLAQHPEAAAGLCKRLEQETDKPAQDAIAYALIRIGGKDVVSGLLPLLRSDDAALRGCVIDILKELPADVAPHMEALLDDPDPDVRIFVVNVLEALRHPKVEDWLIAVISVDAHVNVVATALDLLGELGTEAALPALARVVQRFPGQPFVAFAAAAAQKRIGSGRP